MTALLYTSSCSHSEENVCRRGMESCCLLCLLLGLWVTPVYWLVLTSVRMRCTHWADVLLFWLCFWLLLPGLAARGHLCPGMLKAPDWSVLQCGKYLTLFLSVCARVRMTDVRPRQVILWCLTIYPETGWRLMRGVCVCRRLVCGKETSLSDRGIIRNLSIESWSHPVSRRITAVFLIPSLNRSVVLLDPVLF